MSKLKKHIKTVRRLLKTSPFELLKNPVLLLLIPIALINSIIIRFKRKKTIVYLTETEIDNIISEFDKNEGSFLIVCKYEDFIYFANLRLQEDRNLDIFYQFEIKNRFSRGDFSFIYLNKNGNPVSFLFICTKDAYFTPVNIKLELPPDTFGIYDVYTFNQYRSQGYYRSLFLFTVEAMKEKGYKKIWLWLMAHNHTSIYVHNKLGLVHITKVLINEQFFGLVRKKVIDVSMNLSELLA